MQGIATAGFGCADHALYIEIGARTAAGDIVRLIGNAHME